MGVFQPSGVSGMRVIRSENSDCFCHKSSDIFDRGHNKAHYTFVGFMSSEESGSRCSPKGPVVPCSQFSFCDTEPPLFLELDQERCSVLSQRHRVFPGTTDRSVLTVDPQRIKTLFYHSLEERNSPLLVLHLVIT